MCTVTFDVALYGYATGAILDGGSTAHHFAYDTCSVFFFSGHSATNVQVLDGSTTDKADWRKIFDIGIIRNIESMISTVEGAHKYIRVVCPNPRRYADVVVKLEALIFVNLVGKLTVDELTKVTPVVFIFDKEWIILCAITLDKGGCFNAADGYVGFTHFERTFTVTIELQFMVSAIVVFGAYEVSCNSRLRCNIDCLSFLSSAAVGGYGYTFHIDYFYSISVEIRCELVALDFI